MAAAAPLPLLEALRADARIQPFLKTECTERGVSATLNPKLRPEQVVIISPDAYYKAQRLARQPKSPDCLVVVQCADGTHTVYVVELKSGDFRAREIQEKFTTCLDDFMTNVLGQHFGRTDIGLKPPKLQLVTNGNQSPAHSGRFSRSTRIDALLALPAFDFKGRGLLIEQYERDPLIQPC